MNYLCKFKRCGCQHPLYYEIFRNGTKHLTYFCPQAGKTVRLPFQPGLNIPSQESRPLQKQKAEVTLLSRVEALEARVAELEGKLNCV